MMPIFSKSKITSKIIVFVFLLLIFCFAFFIRAYFPYKAIYSGGVVKYSDDAMYHMRFLENMLLGGHFPSFIYFDAFVNFPHGAYDGIAPLFDFVLAFFIWLISHGKPTLEIIGKIAPFYPVFLGSLIPIVVYFISKALWGDRRVSLLASFFVAISPPILYKSLLGANDHHVAEVLLSSLALMFLFYALKSSKKWLYVFLCGLSMGLYLLTWTGAILFFFIIFAFLSVYFLLEFLLKKPCNWILSAGAIIFLIPFLMVLPFLGHPDINLGAYNINHIICFVLGLSGFLALCLLSIFIQKKSLKRWMIVIFIFIAFLLSLLTLKIFLPDIFSKIIILALGANNNGSSSVTFKNFVSEMKPMGFQGAINNFSSLFLLYLLGFCIFIYNFFKERKPEQLLFVVWSIVTLLITGIFPFFGQLRFHTYLAVNVALLCGFVIVKGFDFAFEALHISSRLDEKIYPFKNYFVAGSITILFSLIFFVVYPFPFNAGLRSPQSWPSFIQTTISVVKNPFVMSDDWYSVFKWLKEKTPDPVIGYYALYQEPKIDQKTGKVNDYSYPENAYGILADWDFGHAIEYYSHRPVVANPFQLGIGKKENGKVTELGSSVFFMETDEDKAISYLDELKAKYVLTDSNFAILESGYFDTMIKWVQGNMDGYLNEPEDALTKYDNSMVARLHLLDGSKTAIEKKVKDKNIDLTIEPLKHFRLLYESATTARILPYKELTKEIKSAKVFEYVKGAKITGKTFSGAEITISTEITTNQGRKFTYENKTTTKDGNFEFIAPYSTGKQENSDVSASEYTIKMGSYTKTVKVSEEDVLQGKTIKIN